MQQKLPGVELPHEHTELWTPCSMADTKLLTHRLLLEQTFWGVETTQWSSNSFPRNCWQQGKSPKFNKVLRKKRKKNDYNKTCKMWSVTKTTVHRDCESANARNTFIVAFGFFCEHDLYLPKHAYYLHVSNFIYLWSQSLARLHQCPISAWDVSHAFFKILDSVSTLIKCRKYFDRERWK